LDRIKWLLWHGNAPKAIDGAEYLADDVAAESEEIPSSVPLRKLAVIFDEFSVAAAGALGALLTGLPDASASPTTLAKATPVDARIGGRPQEASARMESLRACLKKYC
jgi:hypothetical protein